MGRDGRDSRRKEARAGEARRWDSGGEEQLAHFYWNTKQCVRGGRMRKEVAMEAAVRPWGVLDTM